MTTWADVVRKVTAMTDDQLRVVWVNLNDYDPRENYVPGISMDEWASLVYSEMCSRGLSR